MVSKVEFSNPDQVKVISSENDVLKFATELRDSLDGFELKGIDGVIIRFTLPTDKGGVSSHAVYDSYQVLVKDRKLILEDAKRIIKLGLIKLV